MKTEKAAMIGRPKRRRVTFGFKAGPESDVRLAGNFNNWSISTHRLSRKLGLGTFYTKLLLPVGRYEYKFFVNGEWQCDPVCTDRVPNGHGTLNSVVVVQ